MCRGRRAAADRRRRPGGRGRGRRRAVGVAGAPDPGRRRVDARAATGSRLRRRRGRPLVPRRVPDGRLARRARRGLRPCWCGSGGRTADRCMVGALSLGRWRPQACRAGVGARAGTLALRDDRRRGGARVARAASGALHRRGARGVLRALAAADRRDDRCSRRRSPRWSTRCARCRRRATTSARGRRSRRAPCRAYWSNSRQRPALHPSTRHHLRRDQRRAGACPGRSTDSAASATWCAPMWSRSGRPANRSRSQRSVIGADIGCSSRCSLNMSRW